MTQKVAQAFIESVAPSPRFHIRQHHDRVVLPVEQAPEDLLAIGNENGMLPLVKTNGADVMHCPPAVAHHHTTGFASHAAFASGTERVLFVVGRATAYSQDAAYVALWKLNGQ